MVDVQTATLGLAPLFRVGRIPDPLTPPDWRFASPDGTFDGRFDDPRGRHRVPSRDRYRVLYVASQPAGAYGETVARFRPSVRTLSQAGGANPFWRAGHGVIPRDWRVARRIGATVIFVTRPLVDLAHPETMQALRPMLAPMAARLRLADIDLSAVTGPQRELTQEAACTSTSGWTTPARRCLGDCATSRASIPSGSAGRSSWIVRGSVH